MIPFWLKIVVLGILVVGLVTACNFRDRGLIEQGRTEQRVIDQAAADALKREARVALDIALEEKAKTERMLRNNRNSQEIQDAQNKKIVAALNGKLHDLTVNGRLRDPNDTSGRGSSGGSSEGGVTASTNTSRSDSSETSGLLSEPLSRLLQRITAEADEINLAYIACRADAYNIPRNPNGN